MVSTFTTSFGIEKIGVGEQSGAWGTSTNHNLDILDRIASYKAVALSGTTHTLTVREASPGSGGENLQDGMYRVIKFTGALGANNTVTVAPNTAAAFFIIVNATTDSGSGGPYSVILSQGSGANVTIGNGNSAVVYCDGAGSGAAVANALSNLSITALTTSGDITVGGDAIVSGTVLPLGDTAASDKAALGYTAAEGLILTGQGSTNDVTIKNDADADVLEIPTGTTDVAVVGNITAGGTVEPAGDTSAGDNAAIGYTTAEGLILTGQGSTSDITLKNDADAVVFTVPTGTDDILFPDNAKALWGASGDLSIYHNGSHSFIDDSGTGNFYIRSSSFSVQKYTGEDMIIATPDSAVTLYFDNAAKFATTATGVDVTGTIVGDGLTLTTGATVTTVLDEDNMASNSATALSTQQSIKAYVDSQVDTVDTLAEVLAIGNTTGGTDIIVSSGDAVTTNTISETTAASGVTIDGVLVKDGDVDGRDVSVDGTKLDTVETNADVTDATNVAAALTNGVAALTSGEVTQLSNIGTAVISAAEWGYVAASTQAYDSADHTKLNGIEALADVTDATNVLAALVGQQAVATGFTGTLDGVLGGGTPAAITGTSLRLTTGATVTTVLDQDNMSSNSATSLATQQSIKAYVDAQISPQAWSGILLLPANQTYKLVIKCPFAGVITSTTTMCASGTATATFKINTTALGGTANAISTSEQSRTHSSSNAFSVGDDIQVTISSNSSCTDASFSVVYTR